MALAFDHRASSRSWPTRSAPTARASPRFKRLALSRRRAQVAHGDAAASACCSTAATAATRWSRPRRQAFLDRPADRAARLAAAALRRSAHDVGRTLRGMAGRPLRQVPVLLPSGRRRRSCASSRSSSCARLFDACRSDRPRAAARDHRRQARPPVTRRRSPRAHGSGSTRSASSPTGGSCEPQAIAAAWRDDRAR